MRNSKWSIFGLLKQKKRKRIKDILCERKRRFFRDINIEKKYINEKHICALCELHFLLFIGWEKVKTMMEKSQLLWNDVFIILKPLSLVCSGKIMETFIYLISFNFTNCICCKLTWVTVLKFEIVWFIIYV